MRIYYYKPSITTVKRLKFKNFNMFSIIFPGQGSQSIGMGKEFYDKYDLVKALFKEADDTLNMALSKIILEGPKEELYVVQGSQIDSIFYDGLFGFKKVVIPSDANKKFSHFYEKGLKEGEWIEWFVDESPREIYNYKKDLLEGSYAIYDSASAHKIIEKM